MGKITLKLNQKYRSFPENFETELEGNLIILSGVNGSGKSQLIKILSGKIEISNQNSQKIELSRDLEIDGVSINNNEIEIRSFKDNISIPEIVKATSAIVNSSGDQVYQLYITNQLSVGYQNGYFSNCIERAQKILKPLIDTLGDRIPEKQLRDKLREEKFLWKQNDLFTDLIGQMFYYHASEIANGQQKAGKVDGPAFEPSTLGLAPWTELNQLFKLLKLDYRFKDNYEIERAELTEAPKLFLIDLKGDIIEDEFRELVDLSDGEKTIISLCFNSLYKDGNFEQKLLLLDEFDAVLNPSLIESFFLVLEEYYISRGIQVVITTHSPATISLAPNYTTYYEVFKDNISSKRIIKIDRDDYLELQKVNKKFYDKISDQQMRIKVLEETIKTDKPIIIITEGKTDWKHILKALEYFHNNEEFTEINEDYFYRYGSKDDVENNVCGTNIVADLGDVELNNYLTAEIRNRNGKPDLRKNIMIGIFDSDNEKLMPKNKNEFGIYSFKISPDGISTEFLFDEEKYKTKIKGLRLFNGLEFEERSALNIAESVYLGKLISKKSGINVIIDTDVYDFAGENKALSKEKFAQAIFNGEIEITPENWEKFRHIFENIANIIKTENSKYESHP